MTRRTLHGLSFDIISPSFISLTGSPIDISFLGDAWYLSAPMPDGDHRCQQFASRDEAVRYIVDAIEAYRSHQ